MGAPGAAIDVPGSPGGPRRPLWLLWAETLAPRFRAATWSSLRASVVCFLSAPVTATVFVGATALGAAVTAVVTEPVWRSPKKGAGVGRSGEGGGTGQTISGQKQWQLHGCGGGQSPRSRAVSLSCARLKALALFPSLGFFASHWSVVAGRDGVTTSQCFAQNSLASQTLLALDWPGSAASPVTTAASFLMHSNKATTSCFLSFVGSSVGRPTAPLHEEPQSKRQSVVAELTGSGGAAPEAK